MTVAITKEALLSFIIAPVLMVAAMIATDDTKTDSERLQGTWVLIRRERGGEKVYREMVMSGSYHLTRVGIGS